MRALALALVLVASSAGCSVVTPPPLFPRHAPAAALPVGTVEVLALGGAIGGPFVKGSAGGEGRLGVQVSPKLLLGIDFGGGARFEARDEGDTKPGEVLLAGRLYGKADLGVKNLLALDFGVGAGGMDTGLRYVTADVGLVIGHTLRNRIAFFGGPVVAFSVPVVAGEPIDEGQSPVTSFTLGGTAGLAVRVAGGLWLSAEGLFAGVISFADERASIFGGTGGLRYVFGP